MNNIALFTRHSHEYTEDTLRCKLSELLTHILSDSQKRAERLTDEQFDLASPTIPLHFDHQLLRCSLRRIDWKQICDDYNSNINSHSPVSKDSHAVKTKSTTLDLLLDCFENPSIWPCACTMSIFSILVEVLYKNYSLKNNSGMKKLSIESGGQQSVSHKLSDWSPLQNRIMNHLTIILRRNLWMHDISFWTTDNKIWLFYGMDSPGNGEIVLRLLRHWSATFPHSNLVWLSLLAKLIVYLDTVEESLVSSAKLEQHACLAGTIGTTQHFFGSRNRKRGQSVFDFQLLHGESSDKRLDGRLVHEPQEQYSCLPSSDFRGIVHQGTSNPANSVAKDLVNLWKLETKSIEALFTCSQRIINSWTIQKPVPFQSDPMVAIFHELLDVISICENSTTLRTSCVLLAKALEATNQSSYCSHDGIGTLLSLTWWRATNATKINEVETFVQYFCELVIRCSKYDNREIFIAAITPMLMLLNETVISTDSQRRHGCYVQQLYREGFAHILSFRGNLLISPSLRLVREHNLMNGITKLSLLFDRPSDWVSSSLAYTERSKLIKGLQLVGILGLDANESSIASSKKNDQPAIVFPYNSMLYISDITLQKLSPWLPKKLDLIVAAAFSTGTCHANSTNVVSSNQRPRKSDLKEQKPQVGIMDILQEDMVLNVFSFLNYKRLTRMRLVCLNWKILSNTQNLWKELYSKRYKITPEDEANTIHKQGPIDWKTTFVDRHNAERSIRFRISKKHPSWKIRICNHLNCLVVLNSPEFMQKHNKSHKYKCKRKKRFNPNDN